MILSTLSDISSLLSKSQYLNWLWVGIVSTVLLSILGTILGLTLGVFIAFGKRIVVNKKDFWLNKIWKYIVKYFCVIYSVVMRGTPMMVQAMIFQFLCLAMGMNWSMTLVSNQVFNGWFFGGLIVLTLNTAAYMSEIVQSGLNGVGADQTEGAKSLGMNSFQILIHVELPQALRNAIPTIGNEWIVNIKDSSVLNVVGVTELFYRTKDIAGQSYKTLAAYFIVAAIYLILTLCTTLILRIITKKLDGDFKISLFRRKKVNQNEEV